MSKTKVFSSLNYMTLIYWMCNKILCWLSVHISITIEDILPCQYETVIYKFSYQMTEHINIPCIQTMWSFGQNLKKVLTSVVYTPTKKFWNYNYKLPSFQCFQIFRITQGTLCMQKDFLINKRYSRFDPYIYLGNWQTRCCRGCSLNL